jgi:hypothetical protein
VTTVPRDAAVRAAGDRCDGDDVYLSKGCGRASAGGSTRPSSAATSSGGAPPSKANRWAADLLRSQQCSSGPFTASAKGSRPLHVGRCAACVHAADPRAVPVGSRWFYTCRPSSEWRPSFGSHRNKKVIAFFRLRIFK